MLAVYAPDASYLRKAERTLARTNRRVRATGDWKAFEAAAAAAECGVLVVPWLAGDPALDELVLFRARHPLHPVVLVTRGDIENARRLKDVVVDEVVWTHEIERELTDAVSRTCALTHTRLLATTLRRAGTLPAVLREALARASEAERPVRTVQALAAGVGCDRRTLWAQWKEALGGDGGPRLQDFVHWLILLRASTRKSAARTWLAVAEDLGVHPHTLARLARQLTGATLRVLAVRGPAWVAAEFERQALEPLLGHRPDVLRSRAAARARAA